LLTSHCTGAIDTLKHVKKDVMEMGKGTECGIGFEGFEDLQVDDQIQTYEVLEEKRRL
jgi:translation initiation factor IF-2